MSVVVTVFNCVLDVADRGVRRAFYLIHLTFSLKFAVAGQPAASFTAPLALSAAPLICSLSIKRTFLRFLLDNA